MEHLISQTQPETYVLNANAKRMIVLTQLENACLKRNNYLIEKKSAAVRAVSKIHIGIFENFQKRNACPKRNWKTHIRRGEGGECCFFTLR